MSATTIGVIDYGMGNHASVTHTLHDLGFRVRVSDAVEVLDGTDLLLLPGVGAFPAAMRELHQRGLVSYLISQAEAQRPILGICLGMQLLTGASSEHEHTTGLNLIPGRIVAFDHGGWHIGWNTLECARPDALIEPSNGESFYFNHSFHYEGPDEFQMAKTRHWASFASIIRRHNVVGLQFHPEKSQLAGKRLLRNLIKGLANA